MNKQEIEACLLQEREDREQIISMIVRQKEMQCLFKDVYLARPDVMDALEEALHVVDDGIAYLENLLKKMV